MEVLFSPSGQICPFFSRSLQQQQLVDLQHYHRKGDLTARNIPQNIERERSRQGLLVVYPRYCLNCTLGDPVPHKDHRQLLVSAIPFVFGKTISVFPPTRVRAHSHTKVLSRPWSLLWEKCRGQSQTNTVGQQPTAATICNYHPASLMF